VSYGISQVSAEPFHTAPSLHGLYSQNPPAHHRTAPAITSKAIPWAACRPLPFAQAPRKKMLGTAARAVHSKIPVTAGNYNT
jgi:hypothetical protein